MQPIKPNNPNNKRSGRKSRRQTNAKAKNVNAAPTAMSLVTKTRVPTIKATTRGFVVAHREPASGIRAWRSTSTAPATRSTSSTLSTPRKPSTRRSRT
nr:MAG: hypothetical protein 2 [Hubei sediment noda-like virus 8]